MKGIHENHIYHFKQAGRHRWDHSWTSNISIPLAFHYSHFYNVEGMVWRQLSLSGSAVESLVAHQRFQSQWNVITYILKRLKEWCDGNYPLAEHHWKPRWAATISIPMACHHKMLKTLKDDVTESLRGSAALTPSLNIKLLHQLQFPPPKNMSIPVVCHHKHFQNHEGMTRRHLSFSGPAPLKLSLDIKHVNPSGMPSQSFWKMLKEWCDGNYPLAGRHRWNPRWTSNISNPVACHHKHYQNVEGMMWRQLSRSWSAPLKPSVSIRHFNSNCISS